MTCGDVTFWDVRDVNKMAEGISDNVSASSSLVER